MSRTGTCPCHSPRWERVLWQPAKSCDSSSLPLWSGWEAQGTNATHPGHTAANGDELELPKVLVNLSADSGSHCQLTASHVDPAGHQWLMFTRRECLRDELDLISA